MEKLLELTGREHVTPHDHRKSDIFIEFDLFVLHCLSIIHIQNDLFLKT